MVETRVGNCIHILDRMKRLFDFIFCDPPYNMNIDYGSSVVNDNMSDLDYRQFTETWMAACADRLQPFGTLWILVPEQHARLVESTAIMLGLKKRGRIIWRETFGNYNESWFPGGHRHLFAFSTCIRGHNPTWNKDDIRVPSARQTKYKDKRANPKGRVPDDVWDFPRVCGTFKERQKGFPTQLPKELLRRCILATSHPGDLCLDPMMGSGTTGVVAKETGRRFVGIDLIASNVEKAAVRIRKTKKIK